MKISKKWLIILLSTAILSVSCGVGAWLVWKSGKVTAQDLYDRAQALRADGQFDQARIYFYKALEKSTENPHFLWEIASFEAQTGGGAKAQIYAQKAWTVGKRDKECFIALINHSGLPTIDLQVEYGQRLLKDITVESLRRELEADLYFATKDYISALDLYKELYELEPTADFSVKVAVVLISMGQTSEAIKFLGDAIAEAIFDAQSYTLYINLLYLENRDLDLDAIFLAAQKAGVNSFDFSYQQAFLYTIDNRHSDALLILEKLSTRQAEDKQLTKVRILSAYNAYLLKKFDKISALLSFVYDLDSPEAEGEKQFYTMLREFAQLSKRQQQSSLALSVELRKMKNLLPKSFIVKMFSARLQTLYGDVDEALSFYRQEKEPLHKIWSRFLLDHVYALEKAGNFDEALGLLSAFHQAIGKGSRESLGLQRNLLAIQGEFELAFKVQGLLEKLFPADFLLKLERAHLLLESGRLKECKEYLLEKSLESSDAYLPKVEEILILVNLRLGYFEEVLTIIGADQKRLLFRAQALSGLGQFRAAEKLYVELYNSEKTSTNARLLTFFLLSQNKISQARGLMQEQQKNKKSLGWLALAEATLQMNDGNDSMAMKILQNVKKYPMEYHSALHLEADLFYRQGRYLNALENLDLLSVYTPKDFRAFHLKSLCYLALQNTDQAFVAVEKALRLNKSSLLLKMTYSKILLAKKNFSLAYDISLNLLKKGAYKESALSLCLAVLVEQKKTSAALSLLEENSKGVDPLKVVLQKADILFRTGSGRAALQFLGQYTSEMEVKVKMTFMKIALEDQDGYDLESLDVGVPIWAHLGSLFVKRKAYELAAFAYEKVIIGRPEDSLIKNNLAWCYYSLGDFSRAESIIREAHLLDPRNNEIIHTYSQVLRKSKKYQECKNLLQPIIAKSLVDPRHNFSLAVIYEELGQVSEALFEYNKALANSSEGHWTLAQSKKALEAKIATLTKSIK